MYEMSDTILKGDYPRSIPANVWFNMVQVTENSNFFK
jgi:hypothetical protein